MRLFQAFLLISSLLLSSLASAGWINYRNAGGFDSGFCTYYAGIDYPGLPVVFEAESKNCYVFLDYPNTSPCVEPDEWDFEAQACTQPPPDPNDPAGDNDGDGHPNGEDSTPNGEYPDADNDSIADDEDATPNGSGSGDGENGAWEMGDDPWADGTGANPGSIVDDSGRVWEPSDATCDLGAGICMGRWEPTDTFVDPHDPSTWPPNSVPSSSSDAPNAVSPDGVVDYESDPFTDHNHTPNDIPVLVDRDTATTTDDVGTIIDLTKDTRIQPDGDEEVTITRSETRTDGTTTTTTTTTHTDRQTGTKTSTTVVTDKDADGNVTGTNVTGTSTNENGEEEGEGTASGGATCSAPPVCDADPAACAILQQQWLARCPQEDPAELNSGIPEGEEGMSFDDSLGKFKTRMEALPVLQDMESFFTLPSGGSCPTWSVNTWVFSITINQFCSNHIPWGLISGMILAAASFAGFRIAFT